MRPVLDVRNPDLWAGVKPDDMWKSYARAVDKRLSALFDPARPRPFAQVRDGFADRDTLDQTAK